MNKYIKRNVWIAATLLGCLTLTSLAQAASFDCAKAQTKEEHLICDNAELSKLDDELSVAYKAAIQDEAQGDAIKQAQKQWMKERNGCEDAICVKSAYQKRIGQLQPVQTSPDQPKEAKSTVASNSDETACLAPKIDWRNHQWTLITGKGEAICEEMLAYLKSRPADAAPPTCPEERLPKNGNWTRPEIRVLGEAEKQHILQGIPELYRQKDKGPVSYEREIRVSKLLRVVRGDITHDGIPEKFLAIGGDPDIRGICERSKQCANPVEIFRGGIVLQGDWYELLPMNDEGMDVNWGHRVVGNVPILSLGELIYYRGQPYWMSYVSWDQSIEDNFTYTRTRPNDPNSKIFGLYGIGHYVVGQYGGALKPAPFSEVQNLRGNGTACEYGYFHRDNLKQNAARKVK